MSHNRAVPLFRLNVSDYRDMMVRNEEGETRYLWDEKARRWRGKEYDPIEHSWFTVPSLSDLQLQEIVNELDISGSLTARDKRRK